MKVNTTDVSYAWNQFLIHCSSSLSEETKRLQEKGIGQGRIGDIFQALMKNAELNVEKGNPSISSLFPVFVNIKSSNQIDKLTEKAKVDVPGIIIINAIMHFLQLKAYHHYHQHRNLAKLFVAEMSAEMSMIDIIITKMFLSCNSTGESMDDYSPTITIINTESRTAEYQEKATMQSSR
ncbi:hypothetical protein Ocin01_14231 [Orchesella cincta]|uniref:Uncharacterized protein n=1 Tax=Orchesella cincta TaxID=48709 RepID=A0A1D2MHP7_ORCCI|nr:hypothetical protein Ocin01_14231 [Orchesella cincta]